MVQRVGLTPSPMKPSVLTLLLTLATTPAALSAPDPNETRGWLHLNGRTHHFAAPGANDNLFGVGFTWYAPSESSVRTAWEGDVFQDSGRKLSAYLGQSWTVPLWSNSGVGLTVALMYHENFARQNRWRVLPVGLPFWETRGQSLTLRLYYIPPVRSRRDQQVALQALLPFWR